MRSDDPQTRWSAPRLIGGAATALGVLALMLLYSGGAAAVVGATDLALTKSDNPDPVIEGTSLTYTIAVRNPGANDASDVTVDGQAAVACRLRLGEPRLRGDRPHRDLRPGNGRRGVHDDGADHRQGEEGGSRSRTPRASPARRT